MTQTKSVEEMLAGSLIVNEGDAPGRPLGADPEFIVDGRAAASSIIKSISS